MTGDHVARWSNVVVDEDGPDNLGTKEVIAERSRIPPALGGGPFGWNDVSSNGPSVRGLRCTCLTPPDGQMDMMQTGNGAQAGHANGTRDSFRRSDPSSLTECIRLPWVQAWRAT